MIFMHAALVAILFSVEAVMRGRFSSSPGLTYLIIGVLFVYLRPSAINCDTCREAPPRMQLIVPLGGHISGDVQRPAVPGLACGLLVATCNDLWRLALRYTVRHAFPPTRTG